MKSRPVLFALALVVSVAGCRGGDDGGGGDGADGGGGGDDTTIYEIQDEAMPVGTPVTVRGVVVTAVDTFGGRTGGLYVMEPDGGPFSGVFVFLQDATAANLQPGDLVDIEGGVKDEFALSDDDTGRTLTEISPPQNGSTTVTKVGDGTVPAPEVLLPQDLAGDDAEAEKWEGVLVTFKDVRALNAPQGSTQSDPTLNDFDITGPFNVQSSLVEFPMGIARDDCFTDITGIVDYFFVYKVLPRTTADFGGTSTNCLALEDNDTLCGDGADNDFNGFTDCEDLGCIPATVACPVSDTTVTELQDGTITTGTRVSLTGVVVTAVDTIGFNNNSFFIQDATGPAANNGVFVFTLDDNPPGVGTTLDIEGTVSEQDDITQLRQVVLSNQVAGGSPDVLAGQDPAALNGETFEGVLVRVENVRVVNPDLMFGKWSIGESAVPLIIDDDLADLSGVMSPPLTMDQCLSSVTGVMHRNTLDDHASLLPRSVADVDTTPGTCN